MIHANRTALRTLLISVLAIFLAACASSPPTPVVDSKPGYDFRQITKVAFYKMSGQVSGDNPLLLSDMQRNRIDAALESALSKKGFQWVADASQADLLLSWHLATQNKTDVRTYDTPTYGMASARYGGYNRYSAYNCWSCAPTRTEVSVQNYTEGTFIVDLIDPTLRQSVWRGVTQSRLKGKHEQDQGKYNAAADAIFASFPP